MASCQSTKCPHVDEIGITELHTPLEEHKTAADVVFVHGLKGHPHGTWQYGKQQKNPQEKATKSSLKSSLPFKRSKSRDSQLVGEEASETDGSCYWPWDLLASDFENIRILVYGYDSHPTHFYKAATQINISQHGRNLLEAVVSRRNKCKTRPLIFVAHSLGGILVKDAIVESTKFVQQPRVQEVAKSCRAIFFFGTPHRGADAADWGLLLSNIIGTIPPGPSTYKEILRGLSPDSEKLDNLARDFNDILNATVSIEQKIKIFSFQEGKGMTGLARFDGKVVPDSSSGAFGRRDIENSLVLSENHVNMCRFKNKSDSGYYIFKSNLERYLEDIQETAAGTQDLRQEALLKGLDYDGRRVREEQLWGIQAESDTFQWVWQSSFADWVSGPNDLFWICGHPATGKSTLMHYIAKSDELRTSLRHSNASSWTVVYHFFFDFGIREDKRNNFEGVLRSLLCQLSRRLQGQDLIEDLPGIIDGQSWCIRTLRERLTIVLERHANPIFMLLDGLDEYCGDRWALLSFVKEIASARVKVCVASRPTPEFVVGFEKTPKIKMQDLNRPGIEKMVTLTMQTMAGSGFYDDEDIVRLAEGISEKADGIFLWARFAIHEIRAGWAEGLELGSLRKKLDDVPIELEQIYARIFKKLKPDQRQPATHMLQIVCYAVESLSLEELYIATTIAAGGEGRSKQQITPHDIERFTKRVLALTGGVLQLFERNRPTFGHDRDEDVVIVNVIHRTVRTFLDDKGWLQLLGTPHEGLLHAEVLWLRICAQWFPISFKGLPPVTEHNLLTLERMRVRRDTPGALMYQPFLQTAHSGNVNLTNEIPPLMEYSALFMLHHAMNVERDLDLALYNLFQPGISDSFVYYHRLYWALRDGSCLCSSGPEALHFVHLAIAHQLQGYVKDFLSLFCTRTLPGSREWNDVFYLEVPYDEQQDHEHASVLDYFQMSILEFAIGGTYYPCSAVSLLLHLQQLQPRPLDAEIMCALERSSLDVVQLLLPYWPSGKMILKPDPKRIEKYFVTKSPLRNCEVFEDGYNVGPLWCIIKRHGRSDRLLENAEMVDLFLRRGEDINDLCCPVGTALHGAIFNSDANLFSTEWYSITTLIAKGADVNADGPFGTPLELAWELAQKRRYRRPRFRKKTAQIVRELIQNGAVNNKYGLVPSRDSMLEFSDLTDWAP